MKNENFKKRLALALVPILSLTAVIGNVPILPTSVFAVTQDEVKDDEVELNLGDTVDFDDSHSAYFDQPITELPIYNYGQYGEGGGTTTAEETTTAAGTTTTAGTTAATTTTAAGTTTTAGTTAATTTTAAPTTYAISWTVTGGTLKVGDATTSPYTYVKDANAPAPVVEFTADSGKVLTEFTVGGVNKLSKVDAGKYTFETKPTKAVAITAKFETIVCKIGTVNFARLSDAIAYINAQTSAAAYTIDILDNMAAAVSLTLPAATKATSITLKTAKGTAETPVAVNVAISNTTLAIPTELILDNVVLTATGVNLTLSAADSALTVKAGGGIDKVINVSTAAGKVITLHDTTKFVVTGNLSGKPNITLKDDLEIAGSVAIGELTYDASKKVSFTKAATATATITKISTIGNVAAVLEAGILALTIGDIDVDTATTTGFIIKGRQYAVSTTDKTPLYKITGALTIAEGKPIELSLYGKADTDYSALAAIDPTTAIITSINTETTADTFKTSNKNADGVVYSFYKDGTALKLGNNFITLNAKVGVAEAKDIGTFIRLQDAFTYIDGEEDLTEVILKVSGDTPSHGVILFPATEVTIQSASAEDQNKILFTGSVKLNANLTLKDIELSNGNIKGIAFDLNGKNLTLDTASKVIFNNIVDTTKVTKASALNIKDAADLSFLGNINAIGNVNIEDDVIFKGAVANVELIDLKAAKYAYFRGGAITNKLKYVENAKIYLQTTEKGAISKNITIKATEGAVTGTGKLKVNAVIDELTAAKDGLPEKITIKTAGGGSEKVIPGAVIVKLFKDSDAKSSSFVTDAKNIKADTQTLIATKAGTSIKIAAPKLTATAPKVDGVGGGPAFSENFVTIEEALAVVASDALVRDYTLTITDNVVGADLTNIPAKVAVLTAAVPAEGEQLLKVATSKDIGLNDDLTIENLNILAAAKTIGGIVPGVGEEPATYTAATKDLLLSNTSLTVKDAYIKDLTLQDDAIITFKVSGYLANLKLTKGSTVGKIASIPVPKT